MLRTQRREGSLVKCFTFYGSPHSIPTYKVALMMRRIRRSVPLSELPDADAQDVGVFSFPPGASCGSSRQTGCRREECCTIVLHRHFPAVRETPNFEGLFRCRKSLAKREGFAYLLPLSAHRLQWMPPQWRHDRRADDQGEHSALAQMIHRYGCLLRVRRAAGQS